MMVKAAVVKTTMVQTAMQRIFLCLLATLTVACVELPKTQVTLNQYDDLRDDDRDGVINQRDLCIETDAGVYVGGRGCGQWGVKRFIDHAEVEFDFDSTVIHQNDKKELQRIARVLIENPRSKVTLIGDTSPEGSLWYNELLGQRRAAKIEEYLYTLAVPKTRMTRHNFTDNSAEVKKVMSVRERRTFLIVYQPSLNTNKEWTVYSTDEVKNPMSYWKEQYR